MTDLRQRVFAAVAAEPSLPRPAAARRRAALLGAAGLASLLIFLLYGGARPGERPVALWAATSVGAMAIAAAALALAMRRGGSMLGRSASVLVGVAVATPVLLLLLKVALSSAFGMTDYVDERPGFRCLGLALATGILPAAVFLSLWRGTSPAHPRLTGLALGTAAGAAAWVLVDLWCSVGNVRHLLLGHVLPLALLAGMGAAAGRLLAPRATRIDVSNTRARVPDPTLGPSAVRTNPRT